MNSSLDQAFWELLNAALELPPPPDTLYHYTDSAGLLAILQGGKFYASEYRHLNDMAEIREGWNVATDALCDFLAKLTRSLEKKDWMPASILEKLRTLNPKGWDKWLRENNVYVASFSEDWDSLPQWRAYADDGRGFAIGVKNGELAPRSVQSGFYLLRCIYGKQNLERHVQTFISVVASHIGHRVEGIDTDDIDDELVQGGLKFIDQMKAAAESVCRALAASYKSESFSSEKEWRYVLGLSSPRQQLQEFRPSRLGVTPFVYFPVEETDFCRIVLGPCTDKVASRFGIEQLLESLGKRCEVDVSKASYRGK